jgi:hypothetical protein
VLVVASHGIDRFNFPHGSVALRAICRERHIESPA